MAIPQEYFSTVQKIYIAYYQRPADPEGLLYWSQRLDEVNGDLKEIIDAFANSPEAQTLYGGKSIEQILTEIYQAAFNRNPDPEGLKFYTEKIIHGEYSLTDVMLRVLDGAAGDDAIILQKKIEAAQMFTESIDPDLDGKNFTVSYAGDRDAQAAREWLRKIVTTPDVVLPSFEEVENEVIELLSETNHRTLTLISMYIIGSNLESENSAATTDLQEVIQGIGNSDTDDLQILVAFGGSRKQGWIGVKYMDKSCLIQDLWDGELGNDDCYLYEDPEANMGNPATLENFIRFINERYSDYDRKILIFWDHGAAYLGFGGDEIYSNDMLTLPEIKQALYNGNARFDLIGFDACLMGSLEVAKALSPYGRYLVASEELEPGHGWYYTPVISFISQNPDASIVDIGKVIIDSYMNHPNADRGKTLSLMDLSKVDEVVQALNDLVMTLNLEQEFYGQAFIGAVNRARYFGKSSSTDIAYTVDIKDFASHLKEEVNNEIRRETENLVDAVDDMVIYFRQDGTRPRAYGISIFNPQNIRWYGKQYTEQVSPSSEWFTFLGEIYNNNFVLEDKEEPSIVYEGQCVEDGIQGYCYSITDNTFLKGAYAVYIVQDQSNQNIYYIVGFDELDNYENEDDIYFLEDWHGEWIQLCDSEDTESCIVPAAFYYGQTEEGNFVYVAEAIINGINALLFMEYDEDTDNIVDYYYVPYLYDQNTGELLLSKGYSKLEQGDVIQFLYTVYDSFTQGFSRIVSPALTIKSSPEFKWTYLVGQKFYAVLAEDLIGNEAISGLIPVP